ncbi:hypothetical protein [Emcibacter sp. SYSU 3D8]|uniref:hypothetical protein n=1 Tax=Emcibacter sp. SYSU 3D8 TaxID=3133969 RepID=UPI0031FEF9D7
MSTIHQMRIEFDAPEDRLLMSIISKDGKEFRMWFTRRFILLLWPNLLKLAESTPEAAAQASEAARRSIVRFQHEKALAASKFTTTYDKDKVVSQHFGEEPVLITQGGIRRIDNPKGPNQVAFMTKDGKPVTMAMDDVLLHSMARLIRNAVKKAGWNLDLGVLAGETPAAADAQPTPRVLN